MSEGYLYISRKLQDNWLWMAEPFTKGQAWVDLIMMANYEQGFILVRGVKVSVKRGEVARAEATICSRWRWSKSKLRGFLTMLESDQQIIMHKSNVINKIQIVNYDLYQKPTSRPTSKKTAKKLQKDTNKENKENKENMVANMLEAHPTLDVNLEYEKMIDWHLSKGKKIKDYAATFRNWCRKAEEYKKEKGANNGKQSITEQAEHILANI